MNSQQRLVVSVLAAVWVVAGCGGPPKDTPVAQGDASSGHADHAAAPAVRAQRVAGACQTPASERTSEEGCYLTAETPLGVLAATRVFWHLYQFPTREAATAAEGPRTTLAGAFEKTWLYAIAEENWRPTGGEKVAVIGPLAVQAGKPYTARYMEAVFPPGMKPPMAGHRHSGPEAWYVLTGAQCLETPDRLIQAKAGEGAMVEAGPAMAISAVGAETRRAVLLVLHPTDEPWSSPAPEWKPEGRCPR